MPTQVSTKQWLVNIKTAFVLLLTLCFLLSGHWKLTYSQVTPIEQAKQDYSYQTTKYQEARDRYLVAKSNYQAFGTAVAKNEAFAKTQEYVVQTHNVYTTYLLLINERSNLYDWGTSTYSKDDEHKIIEEELKKLEALKEESQKLKTLEETIDHANKLQEQVTKSTLPVAYKLLAKSDFVQILEAEYLFGQIFQKINEKATTKISEKDKPLLLNWKTEVEGTQSEIKEASELKKPELEKALDINMLKIDLPAYEFSTNEERKIFTPTPSLLREILNLI